MADPDLSPNPLVAKLANADAAVNNLVQGNRLTANQAAQVIQGVGELPELVTFAGYFGGELADPRRPDDKKWSLLFLDSTLSGWLLVEPDGIVHRETVTDTETPGDTRDVTRDVIWVKADASVKRGHRPQTPEGQFLQGEFTKAGDFDGAPTGGTLSAATGIFCEAQSPSCCGPRTRPR
jgi:hypothetical protein